MSPCRALVSTRSSFSTAGSPAQPMRCGVPRTRSSSGRASGARRSAPCVRARSPTGKYMATLMPIARRVSYASSATSSSITMPRAGCARATSSSASLLRVPSPILAIWMGEGMRSSLSRLGKSTPQMGIRQSCRFLHRMGIRQSCRFLH